MCGITAYKGEKRAAPILISALRKLEYRGYDSAGIATLDGSINVRKGVGKIDQVNKKESLEDLPGTVGIAHTRWATTGSVTKKNAHPHSADGFAIVHNGIVENYQDLRKELQAKGVTFETETDTEVILKMIIHAGTETLEAVHHVFNRLHGRNAFVLMDSTGTLFAARKGSPLIMGIAKKGIFLASDAAPLLEHTREVVFINDGELVQVGDSYTIYNTNLEQQERNPEHIDWSVEQAQKGNYDHYMLKEIMEQRHTIADALANDKELIEQTAKRIRTAFGTYVVGCGTAGRVALASTYIFSHIAKMHLNFALGSEFPSYHDFLTEKSLLVAISQSGETADTLEAIEVVQELNGNVVSVVNVLGSTMDRIATVTIPVCAGPEISVCSTKATTGQLAITYLLAYACAGKYEEGLRVLKTTAESLNEFLNEAYLSSIRELAETLKQQENMYIIGRGQNYPVALEAAIKIQEVSYIHAEGFAAGELKHGPIALIDKGTPLIAFVPNDDTKENTLTNVLEVKARGGFIIGIAPENNEAFDVHIPVPDVPETSPIVNIIPVQLLAYYLGVARGNDVDMPKNLAKSVTVK